jgi:hypothetical protein
MNRMLVAAFLVLSSLGLSGCGTYDWHQKLTVEIETPEGVKVGSAVTEVSWWENRVFKDGAALQSKIRGEAVVVDLGNGRYLFALLSHADDTGYTADLAPLITMDRDKIVWSVEAITRAKALSGRISVPSKHFPKFATFTDITDPRSVKEVDPANLGTTFGAGYSLKSVTLEITDEAVTKGKIENVLGWVQDHFDGRLDGNRYGTIKSLNPFANSVSSGAFTTWRAR